MAFCLLCKKSLRAFGLFGFFIAFPILYFWSFFDLQSAVLIVAGVAFLIPSLLAIIAKKSRNLRIAPIDDRPSFSQAPETSLPFSSAETPSRWLEMVAHNSVNTWYQNLLIVLSCVVYVRACYSLNYDDEEGNGENFTYHLEDTPFNLSAFEISECFLAVTIGYNMFMRATFRREQHPFQLNTYFFVDILAFVSFLATAQMAPTVSTRVHMYNAYVASGIFRFLRLRRTLKKLDIYEKQRDVVIKVYNKRYILSWRSAGMIILGLRVGQYILSSASLMMFAEYPCAILEPEHCDENFHYFHRTLYFIVVTLSTVGYGDMTPSTDLGLIFLTLIILVGALNVPLAVQQFHDLWQSDQPDFTSQKLDTLQQQVAKVLQNIDNLETLMREEEEKFKKNVSENENAQGLTE